MMKKILFTISTLASLTLFSACELDYAPQNTMVDGLQRRENRAIGPHRGIYPLVRAALGRTQRSEQLYK